MHVFNIKLASPYCHYTDEAAEKPNSEGRMYRIDVESWTVEILTLLNSYSYKMTRTAAAAPAACWIQHLRQHLWEWIIPRPRHIHSWTNVFFHYNHLIITFCLFYLTRNTINRYENKKICKFIQIYSVWHVVCINVQNMFKWHVILIIIIDKL